MFLLELLFYVVIVMNVFVSSQQGSYVGEFSLTVWASSTWFQSLAPQAVQEPGAPGGLEPTLWLECVLCPALRTVLSVM